MFFRLFPRPSSTLVHANGIHLQAPMLLPLMASAWPQSGAGHKWWQADISGSSPLYVTDGSWRAISRMARSSAGRALRRALIVSQSLQQALASAALHCYVLYDVPFTTFPVFPNPSPCLTSPACASRDHLPNRILVSELLSGVTRTKIVAKERAFIEAFFNTFPCWI